MKVLDIFSSIQGEGIYVGYKQIFLRLATCNLSCDYCDEDKGDGEFISSEEILDKLMELSREWHQAIAITGGEPLLQVNELMQILPRLPLPVYLETNSTLPANLEMIKEFISIFALGIKKGYENFFLESLAMVKDEDTFIKLVLLPDESPIYLREIAEKCALINKDIPFVIQPVTPYGKIKHAPSLEKIMMAYNTVKRKMNDVRVIPQTHKFMQIK